MHPLLMKSQEEYFRFNKMTIEITKRLLGLLKEHEDTKKINPKSPEYRFNEVVDYVVESTYMPEIKDVGIYFSTSKAIKSLNKTIKEEVKKELAKDKNSDKELAIALVSQINAYMGAYGFFSTITKDVFVIKDAHLQRIKKTTYKDKKPEKTSKDSWKKEYGFKPTRIPHKEWLRIHHRATLAHELFHYCMDVKSNTSNVLLQEEYAYSNMIGWYRKEGLKDEEIIKASLMWWGKTISISKDPSLQLRERNKDLEKMAIEEAKKLIASYDIMTQTIDESRKNYEERKKDLEDGYFLELM